MAEEGRDVPEDEASAYSTEEGQKRLDDFNK